MQKTDLITQVAKTTGQTQVDTAKTINAALEAITTALKAGEKVTLIGFGTFETRKRAARQGVNPHTQQKIQIPAGKRATFSAGSALKAAVSGKKTPKPKQAAKLAGKKKK